MHGAANDNEEEGPEDEAALVAACARLGEDVESDVEEDRGLGEVGEDLEDEGGGSLGAWRHVLGRVSASGDGSEEDGHDAAQLEGLCECETERGAGGGRGVEQTSEEEGDVDHAHEDADEDEAVVAHVDGLENPGGEDAQGVPDDDRAGKAEDEVDQSGEELLGPDAHPNELAGGSEESDGHGVVHDLRGGSQRGAGQEEGRQEDSQILQRQGRRGWGPL